MLVFDIAWYWMNRGWCRSSVCERCHLQRLLRCHQCRRLRRQQRWTSSAATFRFVRRTTVGLMTNGVPSFLFTAGWWPSLVTSTNTEISTSVSDVSSFRIPPGTHNRWFVFIYESLERSYFKYQFKTDFPFWKLLPSKINNLHQLLMKVKLSKDAMRNVDFAAKVMDCMTVTDILDI